MDVDGTARSETTSVEYNGKTVQASSRTFTAAYFKNKGKSRFDPSIQDAIRLHNIPNATFDDLVAQAEVYITSLSYSQAIHCFTHALLCSRMMWKVKLS